jgi:hypothetical protein
VGPEASEPAISQVKKLSYLSLVIKEGMKHFSCAFALPNFLVLRLYPSVPVNSRAAGRTTTLPTGGGPTGTAPILVRKGEAVGYSVYVLHRRKDIYGPDADEFRPERWENGALNNVGYGYLPFNGGPRICLGQEFALLEAAYTVVRLLQTYETLEMAEGKEFNMPVGHERQLLTMVVSSADGCWVKLKKFSSCSGGIPGTRGG